MVGLEVLEGLRTAEYLQEGSRSAPRQRGEVWKLPLRPPRRTREDLTGHTWWSSHLQTCVFVLIKHLLQEKEVENKPEPYCEELYSVSTKSVSCCCYLHNRAAAALVPPLQLDVLGPVLVPARPDTQLRHLGVLQHVGGQLGSGLQAVAVLPHHRLAVGSHVVLHHPQLDVLSQVAAHDLAPADDHLGRGRSQRKDASGYK